MFTGMTSMQGRAVRRAILLGGLALATLSAQGQAPPPVLGDVNGDGKIDVLDIQAAANIALGTAASVPQADADESTSVNVLDVQVLTNTALGVGGLVQPVTGAFAGAKSLKGTGVVKAVAISTDGRKVEAPVDSATGHFELLLPVKTSWSLSFIDFGATASTVGTVDFPLAGGIVSSLPLQSLSNGNTVDLGSLAAGLGQATHSDLRTLLSVRSTPLDTGDHNGNGLPDFVDSLLQPYPWTVQGSGLVLPSGLDVSQFERNMADCLHDALEHVSLPDLTGIEVGGIPAFAAPIIACLAKEFPDWLESSTNLNSAQVTADTVLLTAIITSRVQTWSQGLGSPDLTDANHNGVPDYLEGQVCHETEGLDAKSGGGPRDGSGSCELDSNGDGIPDYASSSSGDGTPNYLNPATYTADDSDGDGIPNAIDLDDDNDGVLDYADAYPLDPTKS